MHKRILIVEDEQEIRKDILRTLVLSNYEAIGACDGFEGLEKASKYKPDLIISDIMMPRLDGYALLRELQKNPETATIPFLFLSAKSDRNDIRDGMNLGADDFITKPYDIEELLDAVQIRLKKYETNEDIHSKKMERLSSSIHRSIPHEIRTPLSLILGYSDYLLKKFDSTSPYEAKEMIENINEAGKRLNGLFENYLFYANLEDILSNKLQLAKIRSQRTYYPELTIKDTVIHYTDNKGRRNDIRFKIEDTCINISEEYLAKAIKEILDNAIKFSKEDTPIEISARSTGDEYIISIKDYGRGMTKDQIDSTGAYIQFERKLYEQQGSGLGIAIVKKIAEIFNGELEIESKVGSFTSVSLRLNKCESPGRAPLY